MKELRRKQKVRRTIYSIYTLFFLLIVAFFLIKGAWGVWNKERESAKLVKNLEEKITTLSSREQELKAGIARLGTEEGVEDEIRKRFSVTKEDEFMAVIVDDKRTSSTTDGRTMPWYKRFWHAIIDAN